MNNPLEAVTQAVNSLVTALKLPDESAKANEVLGEMSFPQFSRLLPYRDYNQESGLFMNDTTMGFMLEAIPINGANESIVEALDHMLRTKLPRGVPFCIHLMSSQLVGDRIEYGLREFSWSGEQAERFNAINPLTPAGLLAPTYRNQLAFIDIFFRGMNNTNYNMAVCGTSGAGKTGLIQPLIRSVLDSGGFAVVFDMGDDQKH